MDDLKIAAVCMEAAPGEVERNLDRIQGFVSKASAKGADIVCFPELSVSGYVLNNPAKVCRSTDFGKTIDSLVRMSRGSRMVLMASLIESADDAGPYITQVITGPKGLIGLYRKTHLSPTERAIYGAGKEVKIFKYRSTTFGVHLCYEAHFPEMSTTMALMGAEVIFVPHASPRGDAEKKLQSWLRHLPARAFDNGVFVVACNQVGKAEPGLSFPGTAVVIGPDGRLLASYTGGEETILFAELKGDLLQNVRGHRMRYFLPQRRPDLYRDVVSDH